MVRGIYPVVATITDEGFDRVPDDEIAVRFVALLEVLTGREAGSSRLSETSTDTGAVES